METAYLSLGSNVGDRLAYLQQAVEKLNQIEALTVCESSSVYETCPWGVKNQAAFYNLVLKVKTSLLPADLLTACQQIEKELDRTREKRWGPRTMDIDILLYGEKIISSATLQVPHPLMNQRDFVLVPLNEIAPQMLLSGVEIAVHLGRLTTENASPRAVAEIIL